MRLVGHRCARSRLAGAALALLSGCAVSTHASPAVTGLPAHVLRIGLVEWAVQVQARPLAAGLATFLVTNAGTTRHDLRAAGPAGAVQTPLLAPGQSAVLHMRVTAGERLLLWCTVPGHRAQGMHAKIMVARSSVY